MTTTALTAAEVVRIEAKSAGGQVLLACEPIEGETLGTIQQETDSK